MKRVASLTLSPPRWLWLSAIVVVPVLALALLFSDVPSPLPTVGNDILAHILMFGVFSLPYALWAPRKLVYALPLLMALGVGIEFLQPLAGRAFETTDLVGNVIGMAIGASLGLGLRAVLVSVRDHT